MSEKLYIICGPIAVGKTSTTRALNERLLGRASVIEIDAIKRMLDPTASSEWRREIAHSTGLFITEQVLQLPRSVVVETHSLYPEVTKGLADIALRCGAQPIRVLLKAPLEVCLERAANRDHGGVIQYDIDEKMVRRYHANLDPLANDLVFDTRYYSPDDIASNIVEYAQD
jgi:predicted kinase